MAKESFMPSICDRSVINVILIGQESHKCRDGVMERSADVSRDQQMSAEVNRDQQRSEEIGASLLACKEA